MGRSRFQRGKSRAPMGMTPEQRNPTPAVASEVKPPIPDLDRVDVVFGNIKHMPRYDSVPDEFKGWPGNSYVEFVSRWFFSGLKQDDLARLKPRPGVEKNKALAAISAILRSFEPKHEHKEAGCAYLLSCWFDLEAA